MAAVRSIIRALCIYKCLALGATLAFVGSKQYRIERYNIYNCDKSKQQNEYMVFNKGTMKISGGKDKLTYDGYFDVLKDIKEEVMIKGWLTRCNEKNPTDCEYKRKEFDMPTVCSRSDEKEPFQVTHLMHAYMRNVLSDMLKIMKPPVECPVIKKNKYVLNYTTDLTAANLIPLEGSRWTTTYEFKIGGLKPVSLICLDAEMTVRRTSRRN